MSELFPPDYKVLIKHHRDHHVEEARHALECIEIIAKLRATIGWARDVIEWAVATDGQMPTDIQARAMAKSWLEAHPRGSE